jgi:hypothetical protein
LPRRNAGVFFQEYVMLEAFAIIGAIVVIGVLVVGIYTILEFVVKRSS